MKGLLHFKKRFHILFALLVSLCLFFPLIAVTSTSLFILYVYLLCILYFALMCVRPDKNMVILSIVMGSASASTAIAHLIIHGNVTLVLHISITALFHALMIWIVFKDILMTRKVNAETLFEAISLYFMMGITWAYFYIFIQIRNPDAFYMTTSTTFDAGALFYYSFVTLTTLGYGDIIPIAPEARALSFLEAVFGVLFIAVLVARLASSFRHKDRVIDE